MTTLLAFLFLALSISFLCSIMEAVLLSATPSFLWAQAEHGRAWARIFLSFKERVDEPLSAILSLNTMAHTIGAAGVGAQATALFGEAYFGLVSAVLTILILVLTEIIPKTLGAGFWQKLAPVVTYLIRVTLVLTYPLVRLSVLLTRLLSDKDPAKSTSREELAMMARIGKEEGVVSGRESRIIENILNLRHLRVRDIMTPRVVLTLADEEMRLASFLENREHLRHSRIPVYAQDSDHITGYVLRQKVFEHLAIGEHSRQLKDLRREVPVVPETMVLLALWEKLLREREHLAVVVDEYGGLEGVVTMEDVVETVLGLEILDEKDRVADMQRYAREQWRQKRAAGARRPEPRS